MGVSRRSSLLSVPAPAAGGFSPKDISDLTLWIDAAVGVTLNGPDVSQWDDQSGNGNDFTQSTASVQPLYVSSDTSFGGKPSVEFDGVSEYMQTPATLSPAGLTQPNTYVFAARLMTAGSTKALFGGTHSTIRQIFWTFSTTNWYMWASAALFGGTQDTTSAHIFVPIYNSASSALYTDGGTADMTGDPGANDQNGITLGRAPAAGALGHWRVAEFMAYDKALTSAEINQLGGYLSSKYSLSWTDVS